MWQTKYASAVPNNLGLGLNFWPCSEGYFLSSVTKNCSDLSLFEQIVPVISKNFQILGLQP
jgi:hypothetical protein